MVSDQVEFTKVGGERDGCQLKSSRIFQVRLFRMQRACEEDAALVTLELK